MHYDGIISSHLILSASLFISITLSVLGPRFSSGFVCWIRNVVVYLREFCVLIIIIIISTASELLVLVVLSVFVVFLELLLVRLSVVGGNQCPRAVAVVPLCVVSLYVVCRRQPTGSLVVGLVTVLLVVVVVVLVVVVVV